MRHLITMYILLFNFTLSYAESANNEVTTSHTSSGVLDIYHVGSDSACGFDTIQSAINAASNSQNPIEIRVADNQEYDENLTINLNNALIDGGYASCADAIEHIIGGNGAILNRAFGSLGPSIQITGLFVSLKNLQIQDNNNGGIVADESSIINLENMMFSQLASSAISILGNGQIDLRIKNSTFLNNLSDNFGGAISCNGPNHSIEITENTTFLDNQAGILGGAIYLSQGCEATLSGGRLFNNSTIQAGGGGIAMNSSELRLINVVLESNGGTVNGGAISASQSDIYIEGSHFIDNRAFLSQIGSSLGGAIYLTNSNATISSSFFKNNRANMGTTLYSDLDSLIRIEGSIFNQNGNQAANGYGDRSVIHTRDSSITTISYSTFADNNTLFSTFKQAEGSRLNLFSSIIYDPSTVSGNIFESSETSILAINCLIAHESDSFDPTDAEVTVADPMFVDAANGDYHIDASTSLAVDYCHDNVAMAQFKDIDDEIRGYDDPTVTNNIGPFDIGADETYSNDTIFANGFE